MNGAGNHRSQRLLLLLLALCFGLAGVIYVEATEPPLPLPADTAPRATATPDVAGAGRPSFSLPPLNAYAEVAARPLFTETRRPAPGALAGDPASANFTLVGIIISGSDRHALMAHGQPPRTERIVEGQSVDGWTVESILSDRIVLRRVDTRIEVKAKNTSGASGSSQRPPASLLGALPQNAPGSFVNRPTRGSPTASGGR